jgi:ferredoxin
VLKDWDYKILEDETDCCGCSACWQICPRDCIIPTEDREGFLYPVVEPDACIKCGLCLEACPVLVAKPESVVEQEAVLVQAQDGAVLRTSSSGGAFTAIAEWVLGQGGVVFGAAWAEDMRVRHLGVTSGEGLASLRKSKYSQSDKGVSFREVRDLLKSGRLVLYSGLPCEIEGLLAFLRRPQENLITVDVTCHGIPSPGLTASYLSTLKDKVGEPCVAVDFRDKEPYGYQYSQFSIRNHDNEAVYHEGIDTDPLLRAYFEGISTRPSCFSCHFKKRYRPADFTLWDCHRPDRYHPSLDDNRGVTAVMAHSPNGRTILKNVGGVRIVRVDPEALSASNYYMTHSQKSSPRRDAFFRDHSVLGVSELFGKYFPRTMRTQLERFVRRCCVALGIYRPVLRLYQRFSGVR